jgi:F0F1-type ATP synthase assembly protein I
MRKTDDRDFYLFAFRIIGDFSVSIAVPAVLGALLGQWLDARLGTKPWGLITCLFISFALTILSFKRKAARYGAAYDELIKKYDNQVKKV